MNFWRGMQRGESARSFCTKKGEIIWSFRADLLHRRPGIPSTHSTLLQRLTAWDPVLVLQYRGVPARVVFLDEFYFREVF